MCVSFCLVTLKECSKFDCRDVAINGHTHKKKLLLEQCVPYLNISKVLHICSSVRFCLGP